MANTTFSALYAPNGTTLTGIDLDDDGVAEISFVEPPPSLNLNALSSAHRTVVFDTLATIHALNSPESNELFDQIAAKNDPVTIVDLDDLDRLYFNPNNNKVHISPDYVSGMVGSDGEVSAVPFLTHELYHYASGEPDLEDLHASGDLYVPNLELMMR